MENDTVIDAQLEIDPDETSVNEELLAAQPTSLGIKDGTSNT